MIFDREKFLKDSLYGHPGVGTLRSIATSIVVAFVFFGATLNRIRIMPAWHTMFVMGSVLDWCWAMFFDG